MSNWDIQIKPLMMLKNSLEISNSWQESKELLGQHLRGNEEDKNQMITATLALRLLVDLRDRGPMTFQTQATENLYMDLRRDELDLYQHHPPQGASG